MKPLFFVFLFGLCLPIFFIFNFTNFKSAFLASSRSDCSMLLPICCAADQIDLHVWLLLNSQCHPNKSMQPLASASRRSAKNERQKMKECCSALLNTKGKLTHQHSLAFDFTSRVWMLTSKFWPSDNNRI